MILLIPGVEALVRRGARSAHSGSLSATNNVVVRAASASRMVDSFPPDSLPRMEIVRLGMGRRRL